MFRFKIKHLLILTAVLAMPFALYVFAKRVYYWERLTVQSVVSDRTDICDIKILGFDDGLEEIMSTSFQIVGKPGSLIDLDGVENYRDWDGRYPLLRLNRLGNFRFVCAGRAFMGVTKTATGQPVMSNYFRMRLDIGTDSEIAKLIPFEVSSLDGLIENYDQLNELFASWPTESQPGKVTLEDGSDMFYYVILEDVEANVESNESTEE